MSHWDLLIRVLRDRLSEEIRAILKKQKVTAIFVTHDQAEAFAVADRIALLQDGQLAQQNYGNTRGLRLCILHGSKK
jgi:ABC-type Fe3+/spermidine/putrescine transport system ATPase subunit